MSDTLFRWTWDVPRAWAEAVHRLSYRGDRLSYLELHWVAGRPATVDQPDLPIQRWMVFEMVPFSAAIASNWLRAQINAVMGNPWGQAMHHWAATQILTRRVVPVPFWVLQGPYGGHKYRYTNEDREFAMWQGLPDQPPAPGEWSYAPWSPLSENLIRLHSLLTHRRHGTLEAERQARIDALSRQCRRMMLHSIDESGIPDLTAEAAPLLWQETKRVDLGEPAPNAAAPVGDLSAMEAKYVETGTLDPTL